jgi:mRNA interferase MazF
MNIIINRTINRGNIFMVDNGCRTSIGSEQSGKRPAIIVSNEIGNHFSPVVEAVFLTTQSKASMPTHVGISSSARPSTALCEQITPIDVRRIREYVGICTKEFTLK